MVLVIDIGGTFIKYGLIENNVLTNKQKVKTPDGKEIVNLIKEIYEDNNVNQEIEAIGISSAGFIDSINGKVIFATNIPNYSGLEIKKELENILNIPVVVENDVTSCIYNYFTNDLLYISIGTGIGGAYRSDTIFRGANNSEMEVGFLRLERDKTFEDLCSTKALLKKYENKTKLNISGEEFNKYYLKGQKEALDILDEYMEDFTKALETLIYLLDPKTIILGGGVVEAEFFNLKLIEENFEKTSNLLNERKIEVEKSTFGNDAALLGVCKKFKLENS